ARAAWASQTEPPRDPAEAAMAADIAAQSGADDAARAIERLRADESGEADVMLAVLRVRQRDIQAATAALVSAFDEFRATPWAGYRYKLKALTLANTLGKASPEAARRLFRALEQ